MSTTTSTSPIPQYNDYHGSVQNSALNQPPLNQSSSGTNQNKQIAELLSEHNRQSQELDDLADKLKTQSKMTEELLGQCEALLSNQEIKTGFMNTSNGQHVRMQDLTHTPPSSLTQLKCIVVGLILAAIAATAAYYCLTNGLTMIDTPLSSLQLYGGYTLIYMGITFSVVASANFIYAVAKWGCHDPKEKFEYDSSVMKLQFVGSIIAPVAIVPVALILAVFALKR